MEGGRKECNRRWTPMNADERMAMFVVGRPGTMVRKFQSSQGSVSCDSCDSWLNRSSVRRFSNWRSSFPLCPYVQATFLAVLFFVVPRHDTRSPAGSRLNFLSARCPATGGSTKTIPSSVLSANSALQAFRTFRSSNSPCVLRVSVVNCFLKLVADFTDRRRNPTRGRFQIREIWNLNDSRNF